MLVVLWVSILLAFWAGYFGLTQGRPTKHVGFLHYLIFFFMIYLGSLPVYLQRGATNHRFLVSVLLYPLLSFFGMLAGAAFWKRAYLPLGPVTVRPRDVKLVGGVVLSLLVVYAAYLYILGSNIPLLVLFSSGDAAEGRLARFIATKDYSDMVGGLGALVWYPRIFIDYFSSFVLVFAYYHVRSRTRGRLAHYAGFSLLVAGCFLMTVLDTQKYPAAKLFVVFALCLFNARVSKVRLRSLVPAVLVVVGTLVIQGVVYEIVSGQASKLHEGGTIPVLETIFEFGWDMLTTRGILGQSIALYVTYDLVPKTYDFFVGQTLANPRQLLPYKPVAFPYLVCEYSHPESVHAAVRCSAPTVFFGEIYANFGLLVSWMAMFGFGFALQAIHSWLGDRVAQHSTPFNIAFFYLVVVYLGDLAISFITPYFDERIWFFALLWMGHRVTLGHAWRRGAPQEEAAA